MPDIHFRPSIRRIYSFSFGQRLSNDKVLMETLDSEKIHFKSGNYQITNLPSDQHLPNSLLPIDFIIIKINNYLSKDAISVSPISETIETFKLKTKII